MPHKRAKHSARQSQRTAVGHDLAPEKHNLAMEGIPKRISRVLNAASIRSEWKAKGGKRSAEEREGEGHPKKKRKTDVVRDTKDTKEGKGKMLDKDVGLRILPGESLAHFNRRVEDNMRPLVRTAIAASHTQERFAKKQEEEARAAKASSKSTTKNAKSIPPAENDDDEGDNSASGDKPTIQSQKKHQTQVPKPSQTISGSQRQRATEFAALDSSAPRRLNDIAQAPPTLSHVPKLRGSASGGADKSAKKNIADGVLSMAQRAMMEEERERAIQRYRELKERRIAAAAANKT